MNINATLFGQTIAFAVFVWFCMKFVWPPIVTALNERKARITEGLAAAEQGRQEKAAAEQHALKVTDEAKSQAQEILRRAERREAEVIEEAKVAARVEGERLVAAARSEIDKEVNTARETLRKQVAALAVVGAEQILGREVDSQAHSQLLDELATQL